MGGDQSRILIGEETTTIPSILFLRNDGNRLGGINGAAPKKNEKQEIIKHTATIKEHLIKQACEGIFSIQMPLGCGPSARSGHFTVYSKDTHQIFIGFGAKSTGKLNKDIWSLDTTNFSWRRVRTHGDKIKKRSGCGVCLMGDKIIVFGGFTNKEQYLNDLYTIDIKNGFIQKIFNGVQGQWPCPRSFPVVGSHGSKFCVWGGFNGSHPKEMSILDFNTMNWKTIPTKIQGKTSSPYVAFDDKIYGYASSRTGGFTIIDMANENVTFEQVSGSPPPTNVAYPQMVKVGKCYLFYFGGFSQDEKYAHLYVCDVVNYKNSDYNTNADGNNNSNSNGNPIINNTNDSTFSNPETDAAPINLIYRNSNSTPDLLSNEINDSKNNSENNNIIINKNMHGSKSNNKWFCFYVRPDEVTTFDKNGEVINGLFLLPRLCSYSCVYIEEKRKIYAFLGHPETKPPPLYVIDISEGLSSLNLIEDMRLMLHVDSFC